MGESKLPKNQPCPCGSGKKYKRCCGLQDEERRETSFRLRSGLKWAGGAAAALLMVYGVSELDRLGAPFRLWGGNEVPYYTDANINQVDFSKLTEEWSIGRIT